MRHVRQQTTIGLRLLGLAALAIACSEGGEGDRNGGALPDVDLSAPAGAGGGGPTPDRDVLAMTPTPDTVAPPPASVEAACTRDGITFAYQMLVETQADVDALAGCHTIDGSLQIRLFAGIDTTPLLSLRHVTLGLSIFGPDPDTELDTDPRALDGLAQLESVGRLLLAHVRLTDLSAFQRLRSIRPGPTSLVFSEPPDPWGELELEDCEGLTSLSGLGALELVDSVVLERLPQLTRLSGLDSLRTIQVLRIEETPVRDLLGLDRVELSSLLLQGSQVRDLSGLHLRSGAVDSLLQLQHNPLLTSLGGWQAPAALATLSISGNGGLLDLKGLEALQALDLGTFEGEAALTSLDGLEGLRSVGRLDVSSNPRLLTLAGLGGVQSIAELRLSNNGAFSDISGLPAAAEVAELALNLLPSLSTLSGLEDVTLGELSVNDVPLVDLSGLEQTTLNESMDLANMPLLTSLDGAPASSIPGSISLRGCPLLADLRALGAVDALDSLDLTDTGMRNLDDLESLRVLQRLSLDGNTQLEQLDGIAALERLGSLEVANNPVLRALPAFANLVVECTECPLGPTIDVRNNASLEEFGAWPRVETLAAFSVNVNPVLREISLPALRSVDFLDVSRNPRLSVLALPSLERTGQRFILDNGELEDCVSKSDGGDCNGP